MKQTNYKDAVLKIKKIITDVYQQYIELAGWEGLTEVQVRQFQSVDPYMDDVTAQCALKDLSGYLYRYYEKKVIILWMNLIPRCRKRIFMDIGMSLLHLSEVCLMQHLRQIHI